jgi:PAS domain-containing protein
LTINQNYNYMENDKFITKNERETALHYIKTFSDTAREPFLILDPDLKIIGANDSFYKDFQVTKEETENKLIYDLGNRQWDIPELRELLENILPEEKVFNDFEVSREFPKIGLKMMLLNARQLDTTQLILLAIEDITLKRAIETKLANYTKDLEKGIVSQTAELKSRVDELSKLNKIMMGRELKIVELKKEIEELKKKLGGV